MLDNKLDIYKLNVNGKIYEAEATADTPLLWVIRDHLKLYGTKYGCGIGQCGACTIHLNGLPMRSCCLPVGSISEKEIITIEGLSSNGLNSIQEAWLEADVPQCGYCQSGQIMTASALIDRNPDPTDDEIKAAMKGNLCRCGTYPRIIKAIHLAINKLKA